MLRVNSSRAVELEVGLDKRDVQRAVSSIPLPPGVFVTITEAPAR